MEKNKKKVNLTVLPSVRCTAGRPRHIPQRQVLFGGCTPCCPLETEDRCFSGLKQFDLQVLPSFLSLWLCNSFPALTPGIIDTLSTAGKGPRASDGLRSCIPPHTITVLTGDKSLGDGISQRLHRVALAPLAGLSCKFSEQLGRRCCQDNTASCESVRR